MKRSDFIEQIQWPDPYVDFQPIKEPQDLSWHFDRDFLVKVYDYCPRPELIVEVGSWLGNSAIQAARYYTETLNWHNFTLVCIDTWLGSVEHWLRDTENASRKALALQHGYPQLYPHFLSNVMHAGLSPYIQPLPQTSMNAARMLAFFKETLGWSPDWVYIDAAHETLEVFVDMDMYWPLLKQNGVLCGDDWDWPSVRKAVEDFAQDKGLKIFSSKNSWGLIKRGA